MMIKRIKLLGRGFAEDEMINFILDCDNSELKKLLETYVFSGSVFILDDGESFANEDDDELCENCGKYPCEDDGDD